MEHTTDIRILCILISNYEFYRRDTYYLHLFLHFVIFLQLYGKYSFAANNDDLQLGLILA